MFVAGLPPAVQQILKISMYLTTTQSLQRRYLQRFNKSRKYFPGVPAPVQKIREIVSHQGLGVPQLIY